MADNVTLPGTGVPVATKDIGGKQFQKVLPADPITGNPTTATLDSLAAQLPPAGGFSVFIGDAPGATAAKQDTGNTSLASIDEKILESDDSVIYIGGTSYTVKRAVIHANTSGDNTVVAAVAGKKIRVLQYALVCAGAMTVRWESGASGTALTGQMSFAANQGISAPFTPPGLIETASGELLNLELSAASYADGHLLYIEV